MDGYFVVYGYVISYFTQTVCKELLETYKVLWPEGNHLQYVLFLILV